MTDQQPGGPPPYHPPPPHPPTFEPPTQPTVPAAPPAAPPTWGAPPAAPPTWGTPQAYGTPSYGTQAYGTPPPPAPEKKSRAGLIVALLVLAFLVLGGIAIAGVVLLGSSGDLELTIDRCEIAADGELTASGTVQGPSGTGVTIEVEFVDIATDEVVDDDRISVDLGTAVSAGDPWSVRGTAGDDVRQVSCDVTADD